MGFSFYSTGGDKHPNSAGAQKKTAKTRLGCALRHKPKPEPKPDYRGER
jgi:hypothetical protein